MKMCKRYGAVGIFPFLYNIQGFGGRLSSSSSVFVFYFIFFTFQWSEDEENQKKIIRY